MGSNPASRAKNSSEINGLASQGLTRFSLCCAIGVPLREVGTRLEAIRFLGGGAPVASFECAIQRFSIVLFASGREGNRDVQLSASRRSIGADTRDAPAMRRAAELVHEE